MGAFDGHTGIAGLESLTVGVDGGAGNIDVYVYRVEIEVTHDEPGIDIELSIDPVFVQVVIKDNNGQALEDARVYMVASDEIGAFPFEESVTITRSGTVATVSHATHTLVDGDHVKLSGITDKTEDNSGAHLITVTGVNSYTYVTTDSGSTSYTGSIIATGVVINDITGQSGIVSIERELSEGQNVTGFVRKSTDSPRFKSFSLAGNRVDSIVDTTINIRMILDE
jgi:hypothetical protein